jgi:phospholipid/cholesterol/gamma-HCH transport system ATP-binding protein
MPERAAHIGVRNLTMAYGDRVLMRNLDFDVRHGDLFFIIGGSGCGKTTLLRHLVGLNEPAGGEVWYGDVNFTAASDEERERIQRRVGILFQSGALWSSMTLAENVGLPLEQFTPLAPADIEEAATLKLSLVGLRGFEDYFPSEISGGMQKRAGLARAMALDPDVLFFDEPSAGLDPVTSRLLDDLIVSLRDNLGATVVIVSHELASIFAIADDCVFLDTDLRTISARGNPRRLLESPPNENIRRFLTRGRVDGGTGGAP